MTDEKSNKPELIEDEDLEEASGGTETSSPNVRTTKIQAAWPSKIEISSLKAGSSD